MPFVLTVDQIASRVSDDLVGATLDQLGHLDTWLPFTRTVGDEFQALLTDPLSVVDAILILMRTPRWHIGLGLGPVEVPVDAIDPRTARGPGFLAARQAVEAAKGDPSRIVVRAVEPSVAVEDSQTVLRLVGAVLDRRTPAGREVVALLDQGLTQQEVADRLQITRQAVSQRATIAQRSLERAAAPTLVRLLERAEAAVR